MKQLQAVLSYWHADNIFVREETSQIRDMSQKSYMWYLPSSFHKDSREWRTGKSLRYVKTWVALKRQKVTD